MAVRLIKLRGRKVWQARVQFNGQRTSRLCASREEARQAEADLLRQLGEQVAQEEADGAQPATVRKLFEFYVADLEARGKGADTIARAKQTERVMAAVTPDLLDLPVSEVGEREVFAFRAARLTMKVKPSTINRDMRVLRAMLKKARPDFRFPGGAFFWEDETRVRWLAPEEQIIVFGSVRDTAKIGKRKGTRPIPFRDMARLAALTLMRLSEIRLLRREQVRLEQGVVLLPQMKGEPRAVVLSAEARAILRERLEAGSGEWVFPGPDGGPYSRVHVSRVFRKAARATGLQDFHFHDLRHHGATMALNAGFTAPIVMALGGWKTERMMRRYAAVTDKTLRAAAEAVSGNGRWQQAPKPAPAFTPA